MHLVLDTLSRLVHLKDSKTNSEAFKFKSSDSEASILNDFCTDILLIYHVTLIKIANEFKEWLKWLKKA